MARSLLTTDGPHHDRRRQFTEQMARTEVQSLRRAVRPRLARTKARVLLSGVSWVGVGGRKVGKHPMPLRESLVSLVRVSQPLEKEQRMASSRFGRRTARKSLEHGRRLKWGRRSRFVVVAVAGAAFGLALGAGAARAGATFVVTSTADSGVGSLRQAILDANASPGKDRIDFDISGPGVHVIQVLSDLP